MHDGQLSCPSGRPNLVARNFTAERLDQVWLADVSYIPTAEGWLYLAVIKDMATRQIVGWSMAHHLRAELCTAALVMALQRWEPAKGLIHHGDRGVQYASADYRAVLERHGITQSIAGVAIAWTMHRWRASLLP